MPSELRLRMTAYSLQNTTPLLMSEDNDGRGGDTGMLVRGRGMLSSLGGLSLAMLAAATGELAFGQTLADTLTRAERTVGHVELSGKDLVAIEQSMPEVYDAFLSDGLRRLDGTEKYVFLVARLRDEWGDRSPRDAVAWIEGLDEVVSPEEREALERHLESASGRMLKVHMASQRLRNQGTEAYDLLVELKAALTPSVASSFQACIDRIQRNEHECFLSAESGFAEGIRGCLGKRASAGPDAGLMDACVAIKPHELRRQLVQCRIGLSRNEGECLREHRISGNPRKPLTAR